MIKRLLDFIAPPINDPQDAASNKALVRNLSIVLIIASVLGIIADGIIAGNQNTIYLLSPIILFLGLSFWLNQRGKSRFARIFIPLLILIGVSSLLYVGGGSHDTITMAMTLVIIISGLFLGMNGLVIFGILTIIAMLSIVAGEISGLIINRFSFSSDLFDAILILITMSTIIFALRTLINQLSQGRIRAQKSEQEQATTNQELRQLQLSLEDRIAERTSELARQAAEISDQSKELFQANTRIERRAAQLQAIAQVSRAISSIRNLREILPQIAQVISQQFGYYHVGIFLLDEVQETAILSAANSDGGAKMLTRGHRLRVGQVGIVGYVAATGNARIALDTGEDVTFFNNPDLPNTRSEMAVPLKTTGAIIGVLDIQSVEPNAFTEEDVDVIVSLADQVGIAIENARLFDATQKSLAEAETIYRQFLRTEWQRFSRQQNLTGYQYSILGSSPLSEKIKEPEINKALQDGEIHSNDGKKDSIASITVPIKLRDETIGVLNIRTPGQRKWSQDEIDLVSAVADRVAISAENARLFEETTNRAERERAVTEITSKIRSTNDPQEMLHVALEELKQILQVKEARVITREQTK